MPNNLLGKNPELPYDLQTEQAKLAIAQALAMKMMEGGLQPTPSTFQGGGMVFPNWGEQMSAQSMLDRGRRDLTDIGAKQADAAARYNQLLAAAMEQYINTRTGTTGVPGSAPGSPNPVAATRLAATSGIPAMQGIAQADIKEMMGQKDWAQYGDKYALEGRNPFQQTGDPSQLLPMPQYHAQGDVGVVTQGGIPAGKFPARTYTPPSVDPTLGIPTQTTRETGKVEPLTPNLPTVTRETMEMTAAQKQVEESYKNAQGWVAGIKTIKQLRSDLETLPASKMGAMADFRQAVDRFTELLGGRPLPDTANFDTVRGQLASLIMSDIRKLAPVTETDIKFMQNTVGSQNFTMDGLQQILSIVEKRQNEALKEHARIVANYASGFPDPKVQERIRQQWTPGFSFEPTPPARAGGGNNPYLNMTPEERAAEFKRQQGGP